MTSDDSDDEPLSVFASAKKSNQTKSDDERTSDSSYTPEKVKRKKVKKLKMKYPNFKFRTLHTEIQRPMDVWLYLKDLNLTGPYSCLLCPEWFINKSKIVIHYILNHKKDYCGICRYFVPDQETWLTHKKFHVPWCCSQCSEEFQTEADLRKHFSGTHQLVHCRLCSFMMSDNDDYHCHLFQKHNVTNVSSRNEDVIWEVDYNGSPKFLCLLCSKSNNLTIDFFKHFMCYHHFTLKCFTNLLSGKDVPFTIYGANISSGFLATQLHDQTRYGYVDLEQKPINIEPINDESSSNLLEALIPEIKQEVLSDGDGKDDDEVESKDDEEDEETKQLRKELMQYKGQVDFDITLTEMIIIQSCYYEYIESVLNDVKSNTVHKNSNIDYESLKSDKKIQIDCPLCSEKYESINDFAVHMIKMHCIKSVPAFSCRVCATTFDNEIEYQTHIAEELGEFEDLWLCQFCEREFDNRVATREHLSQHWDSLEQDNCFSPHLGFKCKYCPTLFWKEPEREVHHNEFHFSKHIGEFYKCSFCDMTFSDKVWFIHHYWKLHKDDEFKNTVYLIKCRICCVVLSNVDEMKQHFTNHHPEATKIFCSLDPCKFKPLCHLKSFKLHLKAMHDRSTKKAEILDCTVCGRQFSNAKACGTHMTFAHGPGRYKCKICTDVMQSADERNLHYLIKHPGKYHFECNICNKTFQYKSSLYVHRADQHSPKKEAYTCPECSKQFAKKDSFREHMMIHEGPRHACSYCPMRFVQRSNMLRHERRHTGERPYSCLHCSRAFADKGACNSHMRTHSRDTSYPCVYCGQTFAQKSKLKYHIRKHTGENLETCGICAKLFTSGSSLREHMKTHAARQSVGCPICEKTYTDERLMLRHIRIRHSPKNLKTCPVCNKELTTVMGLRQHVLTHSRIKQFHCKGCTKSYSLKKSMMKHLRKRHNVKGEEQYTKQFYRRLDARECQIGLDEEILTAIFGRPKHVNSDVRINDFVTFPSKPIVAKVAEKGGSDDQDMEEEDDKDDTSDDDENGKSNEDNDNQDGESSKSNNDDETEGETVVTNFVCIKIEPIDEQNDDTE